MKHFVTFFLPFLLCTSLLAQWENLGSGVEITPRQYIGLSAVNETTVWALTVNPNFVATATSLDFTKTTDGGLTWQAGTLLDVGNYFSVNIFALDENVAWVVMVSLPQQHQSKILFTNDGGLTWTEQTGEFNDVGHAFAALHFFNEMEGLAFGSPGTSQVSVDSLQIYRTGDGGATWNRIPPAFLPDPLPGEGVWVYSGNNSYDAQGDTLWFVTRAGRVFRTTDKGFSWFAYGAGLDGASLSSVAFESPSTGLVASYDDSRLAKTTDGGASWVELEIDATTAINLGAVEHIPGTLQTYMITDGFIGFAPTALLTRDGGSTWETLDLPPTFSCFQFVSPTAGFGGGVVSLASNTGLYAWTGDLSDPGTHVFGPERNRPGQMAVYPNPAAGGAVQLKLPETAREIGYTVEIYAVDGAKVYETKAGIGLPLQANVEGLSNGRYIVRVTNAENTFSGSFVKNHATGH